MEAQQTNDPIIQGSLEWYRHKFINCSLSLDPHKAQILDNTVDKLVVNQSQYRDVERITNVPWYCVGAIHYRESGFNFHTYLGNGQPLGIKTTLVPAGRGPFNTWLAGACDALDYDGLSGRVGWSLPLCLQLLEKYNGSGYLKYHTSVMSPYLWSFTDLYTVGKYGSDGHFDPKLKDQEVGVAAIFKEMQSRGVI